jgi:hypothetical protein
MHIDIKAPIVIKYKSPADQNKKGKRRASLMPQHKREEILISS